MHLTCIFNKHTCCIMSLQALIIEFLSVSFTPRQSDALWKALGSFTDLDIMPVDLEGRSNTEATEESSLPCRVQKDLCCIRGR